MPYTGLTRVPMHQRERISNPNVDRVDLLSTNQNRQKWENLQHAKLSFSGPGFAFGVGDAWRLPWDWAVRRRSLTRATKKRKARKRTPKKPIYQRVRASLCVKPRHSEISLVQERSISELFTKFRLSSASNKTDGFPICSECHPSFRRGKGMSSFFIVDTSQAKREQWRLARGDAIKIAKITKTSSSSSG